MSATGPRIQTKARAPGRGRLRPAGTAVALVRLIGAAALVAFAGTGAFGEEEGTELLESGSRAPYVHRITLYDHDGAAINPEDEPALPYSPRRTCGKCHPYEQIAHGWHFNACDPNAAPGRAGEPWFLVDDESGHVQAISGRGWPGTRTPQAADLTDFEFIKRFGHHLPGGGYGEPDQQATDESPEFMRWNVSGKLEIDCMFCHSADQQHDPAEAERQIKRENFRWAPTAALGLAIVRGDAGKAPDDWDPYAPPDPDHPEQSGPTLIYDRSRFDADDRVLFNITRRVPNERCYFCHTTRIVGEEAPERWQTDEDVHLAAGLLCVDCHRHDIDHMITRGYEGEAVPTTQPVRASLTCRGCHLGTAEASQIEAALGGRLTAPHPEHRGLPALHLDQLTCTVCHSGPWPRARERLVQTALAHGLGLSRRPEERAPGTRPVIRAPVFMRDEGSEKIGVYRVAEIDGDGQPWYGYAWPLAHEVRPAAQSLGVRECTDCHGSESPIFFGKIEGASQARMYDLTGYDPVLARIWPLGFVGRPAFKWFGIMCAAIIAWLVARTFCDVVSCRVLGLCTVGQTPAGAPPDQPPPRGLTGVEHGVHGLALVGVLIQASTGFGALLTVGELRGWPLLVHMFGAGMFIAGLTLTGLTWARRARLTRTGGSAPGALTAGQRWVFWIVLLVGLAVMLPMLAAMLPIFGYAEQEGLAEWHEIAAIGLLVMMAVHTYVSLAARRAGR